MSTFLQLPQRLVTGVGLQSPTQCGVQQLPRRLVSALGVQAPTQCDVHSGSVVGVEWWQATAVLVVAGLVLSTSNVDRNAA